jgi:NADP-dependent 3-hydroxy acid dehydrogenase YdfG
MFLRHGARRIDPDVEPVAVLTIAPERAPGVGLRHDRAVEERLGDMEQLEAEDIASATLYAVAQPPRVNVNILTLNLAQQP